MVRKVPNLFLIGAPKSGTTALACQLSQHPEIFMGRKEPRFFDARTFYDNPRDAPIRDLEEYLALYDDACATARYCLDASVFNMYSCESILDILALSPEAKFLLVLRDPLEAAKSMHMQRLKYPIGPLREVSESFSECWALLEKRRNGYGYPEGCRNRFLFRYDLLYSYQLYTKFLVDVIPPSNLICIDYQVFQDNPERVHHAIMGVLGLKFFPLKTSRTNASYVIPNGKGGIYSSLQKAALPIARNFPGTRRWLSMMEKWVPQRRIIRGHSSEPVDDEVCRYFLEAYAAMEALCSRYEVNRPLEVK